MTTKHFKAKIESQLVRGELDEAFDILLFTLDNTKRHKEYDNVVLLKSRWEWIKQEQLRGLLSRQDYEISVNKVILGIQTIVNNVEDIGIENYLNDKYIKINNLKAISVLVALLIILIGGKFFIEHYQTSKPNLWTDTTTSSQILKNEGYPGAEPEVLQKDVRVNHDKEERDIGQPNFKQTNSFISSEKVNSVTLNCVIRYRGRILPNAQIVVEGIKSTVSDQNGQVLIQVPKFFVESNMEYDFYVYTDTLLYHRSMRFSNLQFDKI